MQNDTQLILDMMQKGFGTIHRELDSMHKEINGIHKDINGLKEDVSNLKEDVSGLKEDVSVLKQDVSNLKEDVSGLKEDVGELKENVCELNSRVTSIEVTLETDISTKLGALSDGHEGINQKLDIMIAENKTRDERAENTIFRVNRLECDMKLVKNQLAL